MKKTNETVMYYVSFNISLLTDSINNLSLFNAKKKSCLINLDMTHVFPLHRFIDIKQNVLLFPYFSYNQYYIKAKKWSTNTYFA